MRISGGEYKGRTLRTPKGDATRPTSGMVRETLFNILAPWLEGAHLLDLYAGCGSVGLEALGRGAAEAVFVEKARTALACLRSNINALQITTAATVLPLHVERALEQLGKQHLPFDIIFLDPPFADVPAYTRVLQGITDNNLLMEEGQIIAQHDARVSIPNAVGAMQCFRRKDIGDNVLTFYRPEKR